MGKIEDLSLFVQVIDHGSMSKAAAQLHLAKSAISRRLALLEDRYDTCLIDRSPGHWQVTAAGQALYDRAVHAVAEVDDIEAEFASAAFAIAGPLVVSVPRDFGTSFLSEALIAFRRDHPDIDLTVDFDDRVVDLERENYDFAIRITAELIDDLTSHQIGSVNHALYASADYLKQHGKIKQVEKLREHRLINYGSGRSAGWNFLNEKGQPFMFKFKPYLNTNTGLFLCEAALAGLGVVRLPDFIRQKFDPDEQLVPVLPKLKTPAWGIYLIHSQRRRLNRRMRLFLEEMQTACSATA